MENGQFYEQYIGQRIDELSASTADEYPLVRGGIVVGIITISESIDGDYLDVVAGERYSGDELRIVDDSYMEVC